MLPLKHLDQVRTWLSVSAPSIYLTEPTAGTGGARVVWDSVAGMPRGVCLEHTLTALQAAGYDALREGRVERSSHSFEGAYPGCIGTLSRQNVRTRCAAATLQRSAANVKAPPTSVAQLTEGYRRLQTTDRRLQKVTDNSTEDVTATDTEA